MEEEIIKVPTPSNDLEPAAEYIRMSTDIQIYSVEIQQAFIRQYAAAHNMRVVRSYIDEGKSGLRISNRRALRQLLADAQQDRKDFRVILVFDVSRWGRFQDTDESAHYEFLCRRANVRVEYCAEPFQRELGPAHAIVKNIKRAMAAEYSREQSARVYRGLRCTAERGHFAGGSVPYGYRRMLVSPHGSNKGVLGHGIIRAIR